MDINELGTKVINPQSGKSFAQEGRIVEFSSESEACTVVYNRNGIQTEHKKNIEEQFVTALAQKFDASKVFVKTVSDQKTESTAQANLKVGHGPTGQAKKRVPNVKNVIAIASGKGGVGKSTVANNLALTLAQSGLKVGLLDADIYGPSVPMLLGKRDAKPRANDQKKIIPESAFGLKFMSFGLFINEEDPVIWRGPMLGGVLNQFLFDVDWGELDYLVIDLPPGTGDMQLSMVQSTEVDGVIIVSTPQDVALLDAGKGLKMFEQVKVPILGIVENMSGFVCDSCDKVHDIFGSGGAEGLSQKTNVPLLAKIPLEVSMRIGADQGEPYMANKLNVGKPAYRAYQAIVSKLGPAPKNFLSKVFGR